MQSPQITALGYILITLIAETSGQLAHFQCQILGELRQVLPSARSFDTVIWKLSSPSASLPHPSHCYSYMGEVSNVRKIIFVIRTLRFYIITQADADINVCPVPLHLVKCVSLWQVHSFARSDNSFRHKSICYLVFCSLYQFVLTALVSHL